MILMIDVQVRVWDIVRGVQLQILAQHVGPVRCLVFEDGFIASGSQDICVWDSSNYALLHRTASFECNVHIIKV